jgi:hypothetical protein
MESIYQKIGSDIVFPEFKGGLLYMHKTKMDNIILPKEYKRYTETFEQMLKNVKDRNSVCYITIDEKTVCNDTHRRGGIHVDFNWFENLKGHSGHKRYDAIMGSHNDGNSGNGGHNGGSNGGHNGGGNSNGNHGGSPPSTHCSLSEFNKNGGMLLVSNHSACKVYKGLYDGEIGEGGDCSSIDISTLKSEIMKPNDVYFINALGIHEPLVIKERVNRSLIRVNFHPDYVWKNN